MIAGTSETHPGDPAARAATPDGFTPGTILADRYRIVALIGRGGMGEVYRADDLRLGQPVALKFLPPGLSRDPVAHDRLLAEVRNARTVSHPNVCRVYDVGDFDGRSFLTMEYIDGEDLESLLRRIGRLPTAKALEIARQLCAGLAAAHDKGLLHRDLKPANVMIDGRGHARITDFGLAVETRPGSGDSSGAETPNVADFAGTIAYMAPERFQGRAATVQADLYALGLVLYETYTGRHPFRATTIGDWQRAHSDSSPSNPSAIVGDIEPAVERAILRCLEKDPARRPASAAQVALALPGGDPLAAAIAAGETPSPEMVAAAGEEGTLPARTAWLWCAGLAIGLSITIAANTTVSVSNLMPVPQPPEVLQKDAQDLLRTLGYRDPPADTAWRIRDDADYLEHASHATSRQRLPEIASESPGPLVFCYLQGPASLAPSGLSAAEPPMSVRRPQVGEAYVETDLQGHLLYLSVQPTSLEGPPESVRPPDWTPLFAAAGLDMAQFTAVDPRWWSEAASDSRAAWEGPYGSERVRVEAAARRVQPVSFRVVAPWTRPQGAAVPLVGAQRALMTMTVIVLCAAVAVLGLLARQNVRLGRGDRRGARRLAYVMVVLGLGDVLVSHASLAHSNILMILVSALSGAFVPSFLAWLFYLGLEPYVRRRWPHLLIASTRLLDGRWTDPLVGRSIFMALLLSIAFAFPFRLSFRNCSVCPVWSPGSRRTRSTMPGVFCFFFPMRCA